MKSEAVYSAAARGTEPKLVVHSMAYFSVFRLAVTASVGRSPNPTSRLSRSLCSRWPLGPPRILRYRFLFNGCKHFGLPWRFPGQYANHSPNLSPNCAPILVFYYAPILASTVPQFSFLLCPNFRFCRVPIFAVVCPNRAPIFAVGNP